MKSPLLKGIVMTLITVLATTLTTGIPSTLVAWELLGITTLGTVLTYVAKNAMFPSTSILGTIDLKDLVSGLIMAIGSGLSSLAADKVTGSGADIKTIGSVMLTVAIGYLCKNFVSGTNAATGTATPVNTTTKTLLIVGVSTSLLCLSSCSSQRKIDTAKQRVELNESAFAAVGADYTKLHPCLNDSVIQLVHDTSFGRADTVWAYTTALYPNDSIAIHTIRDTITAHIYTTRFIHDSVKVVTVDNRQLGLAYDSLKAYTSLYYNQLSATDKQRRLKNDYLFGLVGVSVALAGSIALRFIKFSV
jgi:hypothetical protein